MDTRRSYDSAYNDGLGHAALHLKRKADKIRDQPVTGPTAEMMARIFDGEADEILALRREA